MPRSWLAGLVGQGVGPSLSPELHEREAGRRGLRYVYKTVDLPAGPVDAADLDALLRGAVRLGFDGLNVTHPVKQLMVPLVDELDPATATLGALNTVLVREGRTIGYNTDVTGFARSVHEGLPGADLDRVVLLGAGGAGTAVAHALLDLGVGRLTVLDPLAERLRTLVSSLPRTSTVVETGGPADLPFAVATASGLVNATPVGMAAHPGSPVAPDLLRPTLWVADIVYRPLATVLVEEARLAGCTVLDGAGMAVHQAADAFELITGLRADRAAMRRDFDDLVAAETAHDAPPAPARDTTTERIR